MNEELKKALKKLTDQYSVMQQDIIEIKKSFLDFRNNIDTKEMQEQKRLLSNCNIQLRNKTSQLKECKRIIDSIMKGGK